MMVKNQISKNLYKNSLVVFICSIIGQIFGYIYNILLSRVLGVEDYGLFSIIISVLTTFSGIALFGQQKTIMRYVSKYYYTNKIEEIKKLLSPLVLISLTLSCILALFLFNDNFLELFGIKNVGVELKVIVAILIPLFVLMNFLYEVLRSLGTAVKKAIIDNLIGKSLKIIIPFCLILIGIPLSINLFIQFELFIVIICLLMTLYSIKKRINMNMITVKIEKPNKEILNFAITMIPASLIFVIIPQIQILLLGYFDKIVDAGIYNVALKTTNIGMMVFVAVNSNFAPMISSLKEKNNFNELYKIFNNAKLIICVLIVCLSGILILFGGKILLLFGQSYTVGYFTLLILIFRLVLDSFFGPIGLLITMGGWSKITLFINFWTLIFSFLTGIFLIPIWGHVGAALSALVATLISQSLYGYFVKKKYGYDIFFYKTFLYFLYIIGIAIGLKEIMDIFSLSNHEILKIAFYLSIYFILALIGFISLFNKYWKEVIKILSNIREQK